MGICAFRRPCGKSVPGDAAGKRAIARSGSRRTTSPVKIARPAGRQRPRGLALLALAALAAFGAGVPHSTAQGSASWQPLGPTAVQSQNFGLVSGRITALALDPSDTTGNTLYVGATGGGVWKSQNAATSSTSNISFTSLSDDLPALNAAQYGSITIGALTVQPGGTGVILAGTGDPNDALDSYYGGGILRSADNGSTWSLIQTTADNVYSFTGEAFAGFAWSTANPQLVVAAVSQAYEGTLVDAVRTHASYEGLYYSTDGGATWALATITDGSGSDVQGPGDTFVNPDGNAATAVVWNPVRQLFIAAVRFHGYYQSSDGITFTRMAGQPGVNLTAALCPANTGLTGSPACPIFRGTLAVNPQTGDTFAWTVDEYSQDQGIWQDQCQVSNNACATTTVWSPAHILQWNTAALETDVPDQGAATILNGDYNLSLAAVPSAQETMLLAGDDDLWQTMCPYSQGCTWRNTTNSTTCMSAQVGEYQHSLAWNTSNPLEIFVGNDSGLWRSADAIAESSVAHPEPVCSPTDASHFQNLNGSLGSLAEVASISQVGATPYTMMAGLGENGTAGVKSTSGVTADWPEILGGEGGPVAIDPANSDNWYVNNQAGVSIQLCAQTADCTPADFGAGAVITDADVGDDGLTMHAPAPFLVDPLDHTQLLIGSCRLWRGPASGAGWSAANAVSPMLDGSANPYCNGDPLIRAMAAMALPASAALPSGGEVVYLGMYGSPDAADGIVSLPGHVFSLTYNAATGSWTAPVDLTLNPIANDTNALNYYGMDISGLFIDPHDPTGQTVYVTVAGIKMMAEDVQVVYRSTDGGAHWTNLVSNLPATPVNSLVVDPEDANTVYLATDVGVYSTRQIANCASTSAACWLTFGSGLPDSPVVELSAAPLSATVKDIVAATYGRGIWMTPLWTASETLTTATATPASWTFPTQQVGASSVAQTVTLKNTATAALTPTSILLSGDFSETDNCQNASVAAGATCAIQVTFAPTQTGSRTGLMTVYANVPGGQLTVALSGTGSLTGTLSLSPPSINFNTSPGNVTGWALGTTSTALQATATNSGSAAVSFTNSVTGPFALASNACGNSIAGNSSCNLTLTFTPTEAGAATGALTFTDSDGTQTIALSGTGLAPPTDGLSATSLGFPFTAENQLSAVETVTLTNSGGVPLTSISISASGAFQQSNNCTANLAANSSCTISVQFVPITASEQSGILTVSDLLRTQTVALSGTGITAPVFSVNPQSLAFAAQPVGAASAAQMLTVTNAGGAPLANVGFQITGVSAASFSTGSTTCGATLSNVSGQNSCTVQVIFTPAISGGAAAALVASSSTPGVAAVTVPLSGTGQNAAGLNVNPAQMAFPIVADGQSSPAQSLKLSNSSSSAVASLIYTVTPPFSLTGNTCGTSLSGGASCSMGVVFSPPLNAPYTGTLTIASGAQTLAIVLLDGTGGVPGAVQFQPNPVIFQQTGVGQTSAATTVTITNPDPVNSLSGVALTASPGFLLVNNACPSTLAAGAGCTVGVEFAPISAGAQHGSLTVTSSTLPGGAFAALSGMGFDFTVVPSGAPGQTVASGQTADYTLSISTLNDSQGVFTFQCGTLPPYASCTFNPASEGVTGGFSGNVTVEIATGIPQTSARALPSLAWPILSLACGIVLLPFAGLRRGRAWLLVAAVALLIGGASGCTTSEVVTSSGSLPHSGPGITPAGTYSIPVTATSNDVSHTVTLTLIVD